MRPLSLNSSRVGVGWLLICRLAFSSLGIDCHSALHLSPQFNSQESHCVFQGTLSHPLPYLSQVLQIFTWGGFQGAGTPRPLSLESTVGGSPLAQEAPQSLERVPSQCTCSSKKVWTLKGFECLWYDSLWFLILVLGRHLQCPAVSLS